mmetsp:Transcript_35409/g.86633  ORF Transcript_35409/g.86633 Transcript_35409/m.86633 type:complete len:203 (+) Transcript_35409:1329-1937(+)
MRGCLHFDKLGLQKSKLWIRRILGGAGLLDKCFDSLLCFLCSSFNGFQIISELIIFVLQIAVPLFQCLLVGEETVQRLLEGDPLSFRNLESLLPTLRLSRPSICCWTRGTVNQDACCLHGDRNDDTFPRCCVRTIANSCAHCAIQQSGAFAPPQIAKTSVAITEPCLHARCQRARPQISVAAATEMQPENRSRKEKKTCSIS